jgi:hypothetical protein
MKILKTYSCETREQMKNDKRKTHGVSRPVTRDGFFAAALCSIIPYKLQHPSKHADLLRKRKRRTKTTTLPPANHALCRFG